MNICICIHTVQAHVRFKGCNADGRINFREFGDRLLISLHSKTPYERIGSCIYTHVTYSYVIYKIHVLNIFWKSGFLHKHVQPKWPQTAEFPLLFGPELCGLDFFLPKVAGIFFGPGEGTRNQWKRWNAATNWCDWIGGKNSSSRSHWNKNLNAWACLDISTHMIHDDGYQIWAQVLVRFS